jgi:hypothetical protein
MGSVAYLEEIDVTRDGALLPGHCWNERDPPPRLDRCDAFLAKPGQTGQQVRCKAGVPDPYPTGG